MKFACSILAAVAATVLIHSSAVAAVPADSGPVAPGHEFGVAVDPAVAAEEKLDPQEAVSALTDSTCNTGKVCFWEQTSYGGGRDEAGEAAALEDRWLGGYDGSAKNRFGARKVQIKNGNSVVLECLDAGDNDWNLPSQAAMFRIGQTGSSC